MSKRFRAKSSKPKRRKPARAKPTSRPANPDETFYEIRGIVDEKYVGGKLLYKVDWVDNPTTGERYDPTWVCFAYFTAPILAPLPPLVDPPYAPTRAPANHDRDATAIRSLLRT